MYGAIIGDKAGSIYEYPEFRESQNSMINVQRRREALKKKEIIPNDSFYSDDTIHTIAILDAIVNNKNYKDTLIEYTLKYNKKETRENYFKSSFSPDTLKWAYGEKKGNSIGNGCCMRISPVGFLFNDFEKVKDEARKATIPSHNDERSVKSAEAIATAIFIARNTKDKYKVQNYIMSNYNYDIFNKIEYLQTHNIFKGTAEETVALCLNVFFKSNNFEDAIRKSLSVGGDSDTNTCIVGSLAEALYGIPKKYINLARQDLPNEFSELLDVGYKKIKILKK